MRSCKRTSFFLLSEYPTGQGHSSDTQHPAEGKDVGDSEWAQLISDFWILVLGAGGGHCGPRSSGFCKGSQKALDFYMLVQVIKANKINKPTVRPLDMGGKGLASSLGGDLGFDCQEPCLPMRRSPSHETGATAQRLVLMALLQLLPATSQTPGLVSTTLQMCMHL